MESGANVQVPSRTCLLSTDICRNEYFLSFDKGPLERYIWWVLL